MAIERFLKLVSGIPEQVKALVVSSGAADGGKIVATVEATGRLSSTVMPLGFGETTISAVAFEAIGTGKFVNFFDDTGTFSIRLADNSNGRSADGFVLASLAISDVADVYPIDGVNTELSGLTPGASYFLGTAGGVITPALDSTDDANATKLNQYLGKSKSATEMVTDDRGYQVL